METMTVTENVALSSVGLGRVDVRAARQRVVDAMERVGVQIEPERLISTLSIGERQRVEIVKALFHECRVLILDEPTAVLPPQDVRALFETVQRLRRTGLGVLFVSHKLREVAEISDRVVVLRRGSLVGERATAEVTTNELASLMMGGTAPEEDVASAVGLPVAEVPEEAPVAPREGAGTAGRRPVLSLTDVTLERPGRPALDHLTFEVRPGEIVGLAGISGNGQTELMNVLGGSELPTSGRVEVDGTDVTRLDVRGRLDAGLGRLTEDRRGSVVPQLSVEHNLVLEDLPSFTRRGMLDKAAIRAHAEEMIRRFDIRATPTDPVSSLSGGNMQKVLLARAPRAGRRCSSRRSRPGPGRRRVPLRPRAAPRAARHGGRGAGHLRGPGRAAQPVRPDPRPVPGRHHRRLPVAEATSERLGAMMTGESVEV